MIENRIIYIDNEWHNVYSYKSHDFNLPFVGALCRKKQSTINRLTKLNTQESTCLECQEHLKNGTFVNFIGEVEKI